MSNHIALIACSKKKLKTAVPIPAKDLYQGQLFKQSLVYCRDVLRILPENTYIMSAKHHIITLDSLLNHYDTTMNDVDYNNWINRCTGVMRSVFATIRPNGHSRTPHVYIIGGAKYRRLGESLAFNTSAMIHFPVPVGLGYAQMIDFMKNHAWCNRCGVRPTTHTMRGVNYEIDLCPNCAELCSVVGCHGSAVLDIGNNEHIELYCDRHAKELKTWKVQS